MLIMTNTIILLTNKVRHIIAKEPSLSVQGGMKS